MKPASFKLLFVLLFFVGSLVSKGQEKYSVSGNVVDAKNGEILFGATIYVVELGQGTSTNDYGFFSLSLPQGEYTLRFNYVGFNSVEKTIDLSDNISALKIELNPSEISLDEVEVPPNEVAKKM